MYRAEIGSPMTVNTDEGRSERPTAEEVTERLLADSGFEGLLQDLVETLMDSTADAQDRVKSVQTFGILTFKKARKVEAEIVAEREGE